MNPPHVIAPIIWSEAGEPRSPRPRCPFPLVIHGIEQATSPRGAPVSLYKPNLSPRQFSSSIRETDPWGRDARLPEVMIWRLIKLPATCEITYGWRNYHGTRGIPDDSYSDSQSPTNSRRLTKLTTSHRAHGDSHILMKLTETSKTVVNNQNPRISQNSRRIPKLKQDDILTAEC